MSNIAAIREPWERVLQNPENQLALVFPIECNKGIWSCCFFIRRLCRLNRFWLLDNRMHMRRIEG